MPLSGSRLPDGMAPPPPGNLREQRSFESTRGQRPSEARLRDDNELTRAQSRPSTAEGRTEPALPAAGPSRLPPPQAPSRLASADSVPRPSLAPSLAPALSITPPASAGRVQPLVSARTETTASLPVDKDGQSAPALSLTIPGRPLARTPSATSVEQYRAAEDNATTLANVEEMLEGFEWRSTAGGAADRIEKRLIGELQAHEAVGRSSLASEWRS